MEYRAEIERFAADRQLDPDLIEAIVQKESSGDPFAWNPEPAYRYLWDVRRNQPFRALTAEENASERPPSDFAALAGDRDQEFWGQQASWGLMQVMGAVARELGFREPYLTKLIDVRINLMLGTRLLKRLLTRLNGSEILALQAYNGGLGGVGKPAPKQYADAVLKIREAIRLR